MKLISYDEFKNDKEYQQFIKENPSIGNLKVEVFTAYKAIPIPNTEIIITKKFNDKVVVFFREYTNSSGIIENILLPAPLPGSVENPFITPKYLVYDLTAVNKEYEVMHNYHIAMFGDVNIIKYIKMAPDLAFKGDSTDGN